MLSSLGVHHLSVLHGWRAHAFKVLTISHSYLLLVCSQLERVRQKGCLMKQNISQQNKKRDKEKVIDRCQRYSHLFFGGLSPFTLASHRMQKGGKSSKFNNRTATAAVG